MIKTIEKVGDVSFVMEFDTVQELLEYERSQEELAGLTVKPTKPESESKTITVSDICGLPSGWLGLWEAINPNDPGPGLIDKLLELQPEVLSPAAEAIKIYLNDNCEYTPINEEAASIADYTVNFASNMLAAYGFKIPESAGDLLLDGYRPFNGNKNLSAKIFKGSHKDLNIIATNGNKFIIEIDSTSIVWSEVK